MTGLRVLQLLRHAKSSWSDPSLADIDRPLSRRGREAASALRDHLASGAVRPEIVVCSPAARARETLSAIEGALGPAEIRIEPLVYGARADELLRLLRGLAPEVRTVMVVGHNPTLQDLALLLAGAGGGVDIERVRAKFPTAALATIAVSDPWSGLGTTPAELRELWTPPRGIVA